MTAGLNRRDYADISNDKAGEKPARRKSKVSLSKANLLRVSRSLS